MTAEEEEEVKSLGAAPAAGGNKRSERNQRRRNRNRGGGGKSKSRSPSVDERAKDGNQRTPKSKSPARQETKSQSPMRHDNNSNHKSRSPTRPFFNKKTQHPDMTVIVNRCDLWDSAAHFQPEETHHHVPQLPNIQVTPFRYAPNVICPGEPQSTAVARVPHCIAKRKFPANLQLQQQQQQHNEGEHYHSDVIDTTTPNPHDPSVVHNKYWCQRRRLFSKFDGGIQLDAEGWFSVTPEIIADHVALRAADLAKSIVENRNDGRGIVILDAFCGCGGNSIAFGKLDSSIVSRVVCVDTDRSKLLKAAHNASLYGIPKDKLIFVECNATFILKYCYKNGQFVLDQPTTAMPQYMPKPAKFTRHAGYRVGGLDLLPRRIDAVFMDPPWGGVDYEVLGKNGYDLKKNMKIRVSPEDDYEGDGDGVGDDFFDTFSTPTTNQKMSQKARKANFNKKTEGDFINGMEMLKVAAEATSSRIVMYDLPRNTSKMSLGQCASEAGYRGNVKLEEHYLNGRLKTVTAYMGADYSSLINDNYNNNYNNNYQESTSTSTPADADGDDQEE